MNKVENSKYYYDPRTMATKVHVISEMESSVSLENQINQFIKDKILIDIKYQSNIAYLKDDDPLIVDRVIILYRDYPF